MAALSFAVISFGVSFGTHNPYQSEPKKPGRINGGFYQKHADWPAQFPSVVIGVPNIKDAMKAVTAAGVGTDRCREAPILVAKT